MPTPPKRPIPHNHPVPETHSVVDAKPQGCAPIIVRLTWMLGGNVALFLFAFSIMKRRAFSVFDAFFWVTVLGLIVVRYLDISKLHGQTADGEPASIRHWVRYVVTLLLASAGLWGVAHSPAARFLAS